MRHFEQSEEVIKAGYTQPIYFKLNDKWYIGYGDRECRPEKLEYNRKMRAATTYILAHKEDIKEFHRTIDSESSIISKRVAPSEYMPIERFVFANRGKHPARVAVIPVSSIKLPHEAIGVFKVFKVAYQG